MEASVLSRCEIQLRVPSAVGVTCHINVAASQTKITGRRSASPYLRSSFKVPLSALRHGPLPYKRAQPRVLIVRATSVEDKGQEAKQKKSNGNIFDFLGYIFKVVLGILSQKKNEYGKLEEKVEHAAEKVKEVADEVEKVAQLTEEIAEKVESESAKDGKIYRAAEVVDKISKAVANKAEIVDNKVEKVEETLKGIESSVENVEDVVEDVATNVSAVGSSMKAEKSSTQTVKVKSS